MWNSKWPVLAVAVLLAAVAVLLYKPAAKPVAQNTTQQNTAQSINWSDILAQHLKIPCTKSLTLIYTYRLPRNYTITGAFGEAARSAPMRLAWHEASLTVVFGNDSAEAYVEVARLLPGRRIYWPPGLCNITIEARTQVVELFVNGTWAEVPPALIRGNYSIELNATGTAVSELLQQHVFETPEQAAQYFDSLIRNITAALIKAGVIMISPPPICIPRQQQQSLCRGDIVGMAERLRLRLGACGRISIECQ